MDKSSEIEHQPKGLLNRGQYLLCLRILQWTLHLAFSATPWFEGFVPFAIYIVITAAMELRPFKRFTIYKGLCNICYFVGSRFESRF